ncbi:hypothetical protein GCM10010266_35670 [Streptomyces griseomycini]|nr:hypothetical protein GCM10010266_35670 [Streptomyces griseomycini]GGR32635.1 hypothetical protein GCM10015536_42940 [Streptomyces griseomycini]
MPEPEGPMTAVKVPRGRERVTSSSAVTALSPDPYRRLTRRRVTASRFLRSAWFPWSLRFLRSPSFLWSLSALGTL